MSASGYHHGNLRQALLQRAVEIIGRDGVEALSLRSLARDLGVSHAAPARHFKTKAELLNAIARDGCEKLIESTSEAVALCDDDPIVRIRALAKAYVNWAVKHPAHHNALRNQEVIRFADQPLKNKLRAFANQQKDALRRAQAKGWKKGVETDTLMFQLVATLVGSAILLSDPVYREVMADICDADLVDYTIERLLAEHTDVRLQKMMWGKSG